jgi:glutamine amidotransferase
MKNCQPFQRELGGRMHVFAHNGDLEPAALDRRRQTVAGFAATIRAFGPANFIYTDGEAVFLHGHLRIHGDGQPPRAPGLHLLSRHCGIDPSAWQGAGVGIGARPEQDIVLAASVPLTDEAGWRALGEGELVVACRGNVSL